MKYLLLAFTTFTLPLYSSSEEIKELSLALIQATKAVREEAKAVIGPRPSFFQQEAYRDVVAMVKSAEQFDLWVNAEPEASVQELQLAIDRTGHQVRWVEMRLDELFKNPDPGSATYKSLWNRLRKCIGLVNQLDKLLHP